MQAAQTLIDRLGLVPHPEGGWYRETWRDATAPGVRGAGTSILFLLESGQRSHWHRIDACELWIHQAGAPLTLRLAAPDGPVRTLTLGVDASVGEQPQIMVPVRDWQSAHAARGWCLVACVVVPAFEFSGFELAPAGWEPGPG